MKKFNKTFGIIAMLAVLSAGAFAQQYEAESNFGEYGGSDALKTAYLSGGAGTYKRASGGSSWKK